MGEGEEEKFKSRAAMVDINQTLRPFQMGAKSMREQKNGMDLNKRNLFPLVEW